MPQLHRRQRAKSLRGVEVRIVVLTRFLGCHTRSPGAAGPRQPSLFGIAMPNRSIGCIQLHASVLTPFNEQMPCHWTAEYFD
jgi:hypothetical protein